MQKVTKQNIKDVLFDLFDHSAQEGLIEYKDMDGDKQEPIIFEDMTGSNDDEINLGVGDTGQSFKIIIIEELKEHDVVKVRKDIAIISNVNGEEKITKIAKGTVGTIVSVYRGTYDSEAFEVEIDNDTHTISFIDLEKIWRET